MTKHDEKPTVDGGHDESNLSGISGAGEMRIDLFGLMLVE